MVERLADHDFDQLLNHRCGAQHRTAPFGTGCPPAGPRDIRRHGLAPCQARRVSNTVALVSVVSSGLVGVIGVGGAIWSGWRDRKAARDLAREERKQQRLADAYIQVLTSAYRLGDWAQSFPVSADPERPKQVALGEAGRHTVEALVGGFGSNELRELCFAWLDVIAEIAEARLNMHSMEDAAIGDGLEARRRYLLDELRPAEAEKRRMLVDQVARELGHRG